MNDVARHKEIVVKKNKNADKGALLDPNMFPIQRLT